MIDHHHWMMTESFRESEAIARAEALGTVSGRRLASLPRLVTQDGVDPPWWIVVQAIPVLLVSGFLCAFGAHTWWVGTFPENVLAPLALLPAAVLIWACADHARRHQIPRLRMSRVPEGIALIREAETLLAESRAKVNADEPEWFAFFDRTVNLRDRQQELLARLR